MNNYILKAKTFFEESISEANKELLEAAISGNIGDVQTLSQLIYRFGQMEKILEEDLGELQNLTQTQNIAPSVPHVNSVTSMPKQKTEPVKPVIEKTNIENLNQEEPEVVPMTADMTNKRPFAVTIFNETHLANSFRAVAETVCRVLYEKNQSAFLNLENNPSVNGDKHKYFSRKQEPGMTDSAIIGSGYKSVYIDVAKLAINNLFFLKRVVTAMNQDPNQIYITIDPSFKRKPREKRAI